MSDELKPCPFCGGEADAWEYEDEQDVLDPISLGYIDTRCITWYCVGCESCEMSTSRLSRDDAVTAWNTRFERTCHMEWRGEVYESQDCIEEDGSYFCTTCDQELTGSLAEAWDDYQAWGYKGEQPFRNCPNCGAKIEGEGR